MILITKAKKAQYGAPATVDTVQVPKTLVPGHTAPMGLGTGNVGVTQTALPGATPTMQNQPTTLATKPAVPGVKAAGIIGAAGQLAGAGAGMIDTAGDTNRFGIQSTNVKKSAGKSALTGAASGAATGATVGSLIGPWGTAIGGVAGAIGGGIVGLLKGKKSAKKANTQAADSTQNAYESYAQKAAANQFAAMAMNGAKFEIVKK